MKCNIGRKNRIGRFIGGLVILSLALYFNQNLIVSGIGAIIGIITVLEGITGYCVVHGLRGTRDMR
ncbi:MAG: DUF2892 domain-containing protein [Candidatus Aenigmarchaeota archaeon]|nr:DUF2892 domain-containing protein [Candidatus Aenigmarchaeota archaeon]